MSQPRREPNSLQDVLTFAIGHQDPGSAPVAVDTIDPERQAWLAEALNRFTANPVEDLKNGIDFIKQSLLTWSSTEADEKTEEDIMAVLEGLLDLVGSIDFANDFHKLDGLSIFPPLLGSGSGQLRMKACELLGEIVQNNPIAQTKVLEADLLPMMTKLLENDANEPVRVKALYALSCLLRENVEAQTIFDDRLDGLSALLRALQLESESHKLRIKASFLLSSLCSCNPAIKETMFKMGFVQQLVALLHSEHNVSHEFLLSALLALINEHESARVEARRPELRLEELLNNKLKSLSDREEYREEVEYSKQLLELCFPKCQNQESER